MGIQVCTTVDRQANEGKEESGMRDDDHHKRVDAKQEP